MNNNRKTTNHSISEIKTSLDDHFRKLTENQMVKSACLGIESLNGDFEWTGIYGTTGPNGDPLQPDTPIWIASVTKLYIASVILKLFEEGRIDIDASISAYLPDELILGIHHTADGTDHTEKITIRHLLNHSSGLPDYLEESPEGEESLLDEILDGDDKEFSIEEAMDLLRNHIPAYFPPQPLDRNKKKVRYSDTNYQLLIEIIKTIKEQSLHEAFTEMIYVPLGLKSTFHPGTRSTESAVVWRGDQPLNIPKAMRSFGDLNSTVDDMNAFMKALIDGRFFDHQETWQLMQRDFNTFGFSLDPTPTAPTWPIAYGLGVMRFKMPRFFTPFRPIPGVVGHTGVSGSWLFYCQELDLVLSGTVNQVNAAGLPFRFIPRLMADRIWNNLP